MKKRMNKEELIELIKSLKIDSEEFWILSSGALGKRYILPNADVMIHQVLGRSEGQASDIEISTKRILKLKKRLNRILAKNTNKSIKEIDKATDRDNYVDALEAVQYGLVDKVI